MMANAAGLGLAGLSRWCGIYLGLLLVLHKITLSSSIQNGSVSYQTQGPTNQTTLNSDSASHLFEDSQIIHLNSTALQKGFVNDSTSFMYTSISPSPGTRLSTAPAESTTTVYTKTVNNSITSAFSALPILSSTRILTSPLDMTTVKATTLVRTRAVNSSSVSILTISPTTTLLTSSLDTKTVKATTLLHTKVVNSSSVSILPISPTKSLFTSSLDTTTVKTTTLLHTRVVNSTSAFILPISPTTTSLDTPSSELSTLHTSSELNTHSSSTTLVGYAYRLSSGISAISSSKSIGYSSGTNAYSINPSVTIQHQTLSKMMSNIPSLYSSELQTESTLWSDIPSAFSSLSTSFIPDLSTKSNSLDKSTFSNLARQNAMVHTNQLISPTKSSSVQYTPSQVSLLSNTQTISITTQVNSHGPLSHVTKTLNTSSALLRPTLPKPMSPAPPSLGASSPSPTRPCSIGGGCCALCLSQLPSTLSFDESESAGTVLAIMNAPIVANISFDVEVVLPVGLQTILKDHFNVTSQGNQFVLMLDREIDLEYLYTKTGRTYDVNQLLVSVHCHESSSNNSVLSVAPKLINVTINDVDDCMPEFQQVTDNTDCVVPIYTADTSEDYLGILDVSPAPIKAIDGDVSQRHNVTYRILHSEPNDYDVYFSLDENEGTVNKTKPMNVSKQNKYVLFVQAMEDSPQQMTRVAILSVEVFAPAERVGGTSTAGNQAAKMALKVFFALLVLAFISGLIVIVHKRYKVHQSRQIISDDVVRDVKLPQLAVYSSSISSLGSIESDPRPTVTSPSEVVVKSPTPIKTHTPKVKMIKVKTPIETSLRPSWNAPTPKFTRPKYNPYLSTIK